jgi:hypothetical protein
MRELEAPEIPPEIQVWAGDREFGNPGLAAGDREGPLALPCPGIAGLRAGGSDHLAIKSWKGDSQATAPIGRKASTSVMPVLELIQTQEILALNGVPQG